MTTDRSDLHAQERAQRAQLIASILGEKDIRLVKWQQLMREGIVIKLKIRRVRFKKRLELKDLGLELPADAKERKAVESLFNLGNKALLPLERLMQLEALESKARKLLSRSSHATEWGSFVPVTQYKAWCEKNEELRQEYFALRDQILRDYKQIVTQVMREYVKAARYTFNILHRIKADEVLSAELDLKKRTYVALVAKSVRENMPTPEEISASFRFEVLKTYIDLPELAQKALPMIAEESPEVREYELQEQSMRERERMLREMNEDVLKAAREQKEELIDSFLGTLVTQTRALIYDASLNVAAAIKSGAGLRPGIITQLKTVVEQVASLKFYDDRDVDRMIALVRSITDQPQENRKRNISDIERVMTEIAMTTRATLLSLNYEFSETRQEREKEMENLSTLQISMQPSAEEVRHARKSLGLSLDELSITQAGPEERESREERGAFPGMSSVSMVGEERQERV